MGVGTKYDIVSMFKVNFMLLLCVRSSLRLEKADFCETSPLLDSGEPQRHDIRDCRVRSAQQGDFPTVVSSAQPAARRPSSLVVALTWDRTRHRTTCSCTALIIFPVPYRGQVVLKGENAKVHARDEIKVKAVDGGRKSEISYVADINLRARSMNAISPPHSTLSYCLA